MTSQVLISSPRKRLQTLKHCHAQQNARVNIIDDLVVRLVDVSLLDLCANFFLVLQNMHLAVRYKTATKKKILQYYSNTFQKKFKYVTRKITPTWELNAQISLLFLLIFLRVPFVNRFNTI